MSCQRFYSYEGQSWGLDPDLCNLTGPSPSPNPEGGQVHGPKLGSGLFTPFYIPSSTFESIPGLGKAG